MISLLPHLLHWLHEYGYPMLWLTVFIAAVGVPLPIGLLLLAVGAFAGYGDFNIVLLIGITITASSCGDNVGYFIGRRWGSRTLNWLVTSRRLHPVSSHTITKARLYFKRRGGWAIFFSRFLFSALASIMNLTSGAECYPYRRFLLYDVTGEALGAVIPLLLGYVLGACWEAGGNLLGAFAVFAFTLLLVIVLVRRMVRKLQHSKETFVAEPVMSTQKSTIYPTLSEATLPRIPEVGDKTLRNKGKKFLVLEEKIEEHNERKGRTDGPFLLSEYAEEECITEEHA